MNSPSSEASFDFVDTLGAENGGGSFEVDESGGSFEVAEKGADQFGAADQQGQTKSGQLLENVVVLQHQTLLKMGEYQKEQQHNQTEICAQIGELKKLVGPVAAGALTEQRRAEADQALQAKHQKLLMDHEALRAEIAEMKQLQKMQEQRQAQMLQGLDELRKAFTGGSVGTEAVKEGTGDGTDADKEGEGTEDGTETVKEGSEDGTETDKEEAEDGTEAVKEGTGDETEAVKEGSEDGTETDKEEAEDGTEAVKEGTGDETEAVKEGTGDETEAVKEGTGDETEAVKEGTGTEVVKEGTGDGVQMHASGAPYALTPHNRWDVVTSCRELMLIEPKRLIVVQRDGKFDHCVCCCAFAERPIPKKNVGIFYFELKFIENNGFVRIGLAPIQMPLEEDSAVCKGVYVYLPWDTVPGDVVGYSLNLATRQIIYTRNGVVMDSRKALPPHSDVDLFPYVLLPSLGDKVEANFGPNFAFNIADGI
uniref:SPRY domain-containing protein n=1 Tax=Globodera rostochiensis TaxID=31243 RepID=A0A914HEW5_GLORO